MVAITALLLFETDDAVFVIVGVNFGVWVVDDGSGFEVWGRADVLGRGGK